MLVPTILTKDFTRDDLEPTLRKGIAEEVVVRNGSSWKCPTYVQRLPPCKDACPSSEDIRGYLTVIAQASQYKMTQEQALDQAWEILTDKNPLPATHGRICPHPCESGCNRQHKEDGSVAINNMERFIGDHGLRRKLKFKRLTDEKKAQKVAVIGSGPSGLSCAYQMARRGYAVTIFEAFEKAGGMLRYGIPTYRLPDEVLDGEIQNILDLGVELKCNTRIGRDVSFEQLRKEFSAIYLALGAHKGSNMGIPGENSANVFTAASFLNRVNTGAKVEIGKRVVVIGGGDSAMDAARVSLRLQKDLLAAEESGDEARYDAVRQAIDEEARKEEEVVTTEKTAVDSARIVRRVAGGSEVTILYRRTKDEMPAIAKDVDEAMEEGVRFELLAAPVELITEGGRAVAARCIRMQLGAPDKSGRRRPEPIPGSEFTVPCDTVIMGIGQVPELEEGMAGLADKWGWISANTSFETSLPGVFAGGDVLGLGISTRSVGHGRQAARAMHSFLKGAKHQLPSKVKPIRVEEMRLDYYRALPRNEEARLEVAEAIEGFKETTFTITAEQAMEEAKRCMSCGLCFACDQCRIFCPKETIHRDLKRPQGQVMFTDYTKCNGCHVCFQACPCGYIQMGMGL
ncbi:MAG: FAD-dependent oxidoreductase [Magnetococcales bacterium]|nr:FAD-dependent oxidoreductase [Magnetococcales bacterium]MBF0113964.1 FAD-dependent oxidoreductase [Magnetococcales bacterium]